MARGPEAVPGPFALLSAEEFHGAVSTGLSPRLAEMGFSAVGKGRWTRDRVVHVRDLVRLQAMKGSSYSAAWGISLDFVPHLRSGGTIAWHKTPKSAMFDLVYDPLDYEGDTEAFALSLFDTKEELVVDVAVLANRLASALPAFFEPIRSLADVLSAFEAKPRRPFVRFGVQNYPQQQLALAFLLAKLGSRSAAVEALGQFVEQFEIVEPVAGRLGGLLEECS